MDAKKPSDLSLRGSRKIYSYERDEKLRLVWFTFINRQDGCREICNVATGSYRRVVVRKSILEKIEENNTSDLAKTDIR